MALGSLESQMQYSSHCTEVKPEAQSIPELTQKGMWEDVICCVLGV